jgi:hypothetical protein
LIIKDRAEVMENVATDENWKVCFSQIAPGLLLFARQWTRSTADAEEAFVRFWRKQHSGRPQAARRAAGQIRIRSSGENGLATTNIDIGKAQIVFSDDKGELRIENFDGKKVLTAKNPQGLLLFSGPAETKEDLDKVPMDVRQRFEKLQEHDLPAVISPDDAVKGASSTDNDDDEDEDETSSTEEGSICVVGASIFLI